jgi:sulfatase maturation enzyme AslB (radical SAM superfamily)
MIIYWVCTTIDGGKGLHSKRRIASRENENFDKIVRNINKIIELHIPITISINVDKNNIDHLSDYFYTANINNWSNNDLVKLEIGRVDDRLWDANLDQKNIQKISEKIDELANVKCIIEVRHRNK